MSPTPEQEPSVDGRPQGPLMDKVDRHEWGPTEPDEMAVLGKLFAYNPITGLFSYQMGDPGA